MSKVPPEWVSLLVPFGFKKRSTALFRKVGDVEQTIFAKKNLYEETFQIWVTVAIFDPYRENGREYVFIGYLCPGRLRFFATDDTWWPPSELSKASESILTHAVPWLESHKLLSELLFDVEECLAQKKSWHSYFEGQTAPSHPENGLYYVASLLHMKLGNKEAACRRSYEWLTFVKGSTGVEPARTLRQIKDLGCQPQEGDFQRLQ